ncbi:MAG: VOC family protein [Acidimicrobiia bacterium]
MSKLTLIAAAIVTSFATQEPGPHYRPSVVVQLAVTNLEKSIAFYEDVLRFRAVERRDDLQFAHVDTNVPGLQIGLSVGGSATGTGGAIVNLSVADVVSARKLLESRGVVFKGATQIIPGKVALAGFTDPDGNLLRLAGPAPRK